MWRLATSGLAAETRWLAPVVLCTSLALGSLLPVQWAVDAGRMGSLAYLRQALGADLRIDLSEARAAAPPAEIQAALANLPRGSEMTLGRELSARIEGSAEARVRVLAVCGNYPLYGGETWSRPPEEALARGVAISAGLLALAEGDRISLLGLDLPVEAVFPESPLVPGSLQVDGTVVIAATLLEEVPGRDFVLVKLPEGASPTILADDLVRRLGRSAVVGLADLAPVLELGLERLGTVCFWSSVTIIFMAAFGIAFGVEDYVRSRSPEHAVLRTLGAPAGLPFALTAFRLALAGALAGLLSTLWGWLLRTLTLELAGAQARPLVLLSTPSHPAWSFLLLGPLLALVYGAWPLALTLRIRPSLALRAKLAGFLVPDERRGDGLLSLAGVAVVTLIMVPVLGRLFIGGAFFTLPVAWLIVVFGGLLGAAVALVVAVLAGLGQAAPVALRWPLIYFRLGRDRAVITMTALALALAVGTGAALVGRALTWDLQVALSRQVPMSLIAFSTSGPTAGEDLRRAQDLLEARDDVEAVTIGGVNSLRAVYVNGRPLLRPLAMAIKLVDPNHAGLYNSTLTPGLVAMAAPGSFPCTVWAEWADRAGLTLGDLVDVVGPSGELVRLQIVGLEPHQGIRVGIVAPVSVPRGAWASEFDFIVARLDPARSGLLARELAGLIPGLKVLDLGGLLTVLRAAVADLLFLWWVAAAFSLLVSVSLCLTMSSIIRIRRSAELALFRVLGASRWQLRAGPLAEALIEGLVAGGIGGGVAQAALLKLMSYLSGVGVAFDRTILAMATGVALVLALGRQLVSFRRSLARPAMEVLRRE